VNQLVGKSVLIGITCVSAGGAEVDRFQTYGTIAEVSDRWIAVRREGLSEPFGLPPAPELLEPAGEGVYTLRSTGQQIERPDYVATLTVSCPDAESLLTLRGLGFVPSR
jgi:hypothetical protein